MRSENSAQPLGSGVKFLARRPAPEAEADRTHADFGRDAHSLRTGDSSMRPEWHAEPVEAATPSNRSSISAPTRPMKETLSVFGRRCAGCPLRATRLPNRA